MHRVAAGYAVTPSPCPQRAGRAAATMLAALAVPAAAEVLFNPYAAARYQYDSNVYRFSSQVAQVTGTTSTDDTSQRLLAGSDVGYVWSRQRLQVMGELRQITFDEFEHLDHDEYAAAGAYTGEILSNTKVELELKDERRMASFEDRRTTLLIMERERSGRGALTVAVTPAWRVVTGARGRQLHSPLPDAPALPQPPPGAPARIASPDFRLRESAINAGVQFGIENKEHPEEEAPLLVGALLEYSTVDFSGFTPQPPPPPGVTRETFDGYALLSLAATGAYTISGLSTFDAKVGITLFNPSKTAADSRPDVTGEIGYTRRLSVVTQLDAHVFRRIVPYAATADATTDTGISVGAKWEPLRDLTVLGDYALASSSFDELSGVAPENDGRSDTVQSATLSVAYPQLRMFHLRVYGTYADRRSNLSYNDFNDVTAGAELSFRWGGKKPPVD